MSYIQLAPTDLVVSNDAVTAPAWSSGNPTLVGSNMYFYPAVSPSPSFYVDIYEATSTVTSSIPQFFSNLQGS
jgi:hypothetical protein